MKTGLSRYDDTMTEAQAQFNAAVEEFIALNLDRSRNMPAYLYGVNWYELPVIQKKANLYGLGIRATRLLGGYRVKCLKKNDIGAYS